MKTTFLPVLAIGLATTLMMQMGRADSAPPTREEGDASETAPATSLDSALMQPGAAKVAGRNVNVRAQATINSEVVTQMQDGEEVFIEQVILRPDAKGQDPARWAKIAYPAEAPAWVHSSFVDAQSGTVKPRKLNVRSGPGENYTVVGSLRAGDTVASLGSKGDWLLIQPPPGSTAYIAAKLLRQEAPAEEVGVTETEVTETEVVATQPVIAAGSETSEPEMAVVDETPAVAEQTGGATTVGDTEGTEGASDLAQLPEVAPVLETVPEEPLPPRIVDREGIVRTFTEPHAPSSYKLVSPDNGRLINYLYTTSTNLDLGRYVGLHIIATGEEALDARWKTPVLTLKRIVLVDYED